ncbi:MAG: S-layer homology domain-containing protein [Peptococcaceae bacterium]
MRHNWPPYLLYILIALLLLALFPACALTEVRPAVSLEQAIRTVKVNLTIPKECTRFTSSYTSEQDHQTWSLNWNAPEEPGGSFNVQVDAKTGEILNMNTWKPEKRSELGLRIPAVSEAKARQVADELLRRLLPERLPDLQPVTTEDQLIPLYDGSFTYTFRWQRKVNGVLFPGNEVTVGVRGDDGQVASYNLDWTKASLPAAAGAISPVKARQAFERAGMLELQYFLPPSPRPVTAEDEQKRCVQLVYRLYHPSGGVIDAFSGEPLVLPGKWLRQNSADSGKDQMVGGNKMTIPGNTVVPLSPEEIKEIEKTAKLITKEEAVASVKKWVAVPKNLTLEQANLASHWQSPDVRLWHLNWRTDKNRTSGSRYMSAQVNALTGELTGFDLSSPLAGAEKPGILDRAAAQKMAAEFLQKIQSQRFREVKLDEIDPLNEPRILKKGQNPPDQFFKYRRVVNNIPFPDDGMTVRVDTVTKRIIYYNLEWSNLAFPAPEGILGTKAATDAFLKIRLLTLSYVQVYGPSGPGEVRLVYQPLAAPGIPASDLFDARTGEFLDRKGKPLSLRPRAYRFNDIAGNFAEKEISLLGRAGIFGEYGDAFRPGEKVTVVSLLRAMLMAKGNLWDGGKLTDQEILKRARKQGWLKEDLPPGGTVRRENLVKLLVRMLNLDRAARVEGIYRVPYADAASLSPGSLGYVALAWGLGIVKTDGANFVPGHEVTRAEAAVALVQTLKAVQE